MKLYAHEEMLDEMVGAKGTPAKDNYEQQIDKYLKVLHSTKSLSELTSLDIKPNK